MHTFGVFIKTATGINMIYGNLINTIFNMGVSLFMLISGYFGAKTDWKKIIKLEVIAIVYSLLNYLTVTAITGVWSIKALIKSCAPTFSQQKWFFTSYIIILIFADYINLIPEKLSKKRFEYLLFLMLMIFSIIPTVIYFHPTNANSGKGLMNLFLMYLTGRYIRKYGGGVRYDTIAILLVLTQTVQFCLNIFVSVVLFKGVGVYAVFARDCSLLIIVGSVFVFLLAGKYKFYSKTINGLASHVLEIYFFEETVRMVINYYFPLTPFADKWYLFAIIGLYVVSVMLICILIDIIRMFLFGKVEDLICESIFRSVNKVIGYAEKHKKIIFKKACK